MQIVVKQYQHLLISSSSFNRSLLLSANVIAVAAIYACVVMNISNSLQLQIRTQHIILRHANFALCLINVTLKGANY